MAKRTTQKELQVTKKLRANIKKLIASLSVFSSVAFQGFPP